MTSGAAQGIADPCEAEAGEALVGAVAGVLEVADPGASDRRGIGMVFRHYAVPAQGFGSRTAWRGGLVRVRTWADDSRGKTWTLACAQGSRLVEILT